MTHQSIQDLFWMKWHLYRFFLLQVLHLSLFSLHQSSIHIYLLLVQQALLGCSTKGLSPILTPRSLILILDFVVGCCAIDLTQMLTHHSPVLRARTCILLQLLSRYSCRALQLNWTQRLQEDLESLMHDSNKMVQVVSIRIVHAWNSGFPVTLCIPVFISFMDQLGNSELQPPVCHIGMVCIHADNVTLSQYSVNWVKGHSVQFPFASDCLGSFSLVELPHRVCKLFCFIFVVASLWS